MEVQWPQLVFSQPFFDRVNALAIRRFGDETIADESVTYTIQALSEEDWARCKKFTGKSKPETYLYSIASNLIEEFSRKKFGRQRPPEWLKREGELWITLWRQICLERLHIATVIDRHCATQLREPGRIAQIVSVIKGRIPWCGVKDAPTSLDQTLTSDSETTFLDTIDSEPSLEANIEQACLTEALHLIASLLHGEEEWQPHIPFEKWQGVRDALSLSDEDALMLRMHFCDGLSFSAIARHLGVANHVPGRQTKKLLEHIASVLKSHNLHWDSLINDSTEASYVS